MSKIKIDVVRHKTDTDKVCRKQARSRNRFFDLSPLEKLDVESVANAPQFQGAIVPGEPPVEAQYFLLPIRTPSQRIHGIFPLLPRLHSYQSNCVIFLSSNLVARQYKNAIFFLTIGSCFSNRFSLRSLSSELVAFATTHVPEPSTAVLAGLGGLAALAYSFARKRK